MSELTKPMAVPPSVVDPHRLAALDSYGILDTPAEVGFDEIVQLATLLCDTPVALISLVAGNRQWFKARIGFPPCETDLSSSVCAHALAEPDLLIVTDLTVDPRTKNNPLVTGEPHIRFYAGAPLRNAAGYVLGSLCVIDGQPRPSGLTPKQIEGLRALAGQVVSQLELRRVVKQQQETQALLQTGTAELADSEAYWRGLFKQLREGFVVGQVVKDDKGSITDWRYVDVNRAWETWSAEARVSEAVAPQADGARQDAKVAGDLGVASPAAAFSAIRARNASRCASVGMRSRASSSARPSGASRTSLASGIIQRVNHESGGFCEVREGRVGRTSADVTEAGLNEGAGSLAAMGKARRWLAFAVWIGVAWRLLLLRSPRLSMTRGPM